MSSCSTKNTCHLLDEQDGREAASAISSTTSYWAEMDISKGLQMVGCLSHIGYMGHISYALDFVVHRRLKGN